MADDPRTFWANQVTWESMQATIQQMQQQISLLNAHVETLSATVESLKDDLAARDSFADAPRPAKIALLPATTSKESFAESKATRKLPAMSAKTMKVVRSLMGLDALAGIAQEDIYQVIEAHQSGISKSKIYLALGWGSKKHTTIVKPVVDALVSSKALQAV